MSGAYDLVVVANRPPRDADTAGAAPFPGDRDTGGPLAAIAPILVSRNGIWVSGTDSARPAARKPLPEDGIRVRPVRMTGDELDQFFHGQANSAIWPVYHDAVQQPVFHPDWRLAYRDVNRRFAEAAALAAAPGALIWVHDYDLQLVPGMLRPLRPDARIALSLHTPFPPVELFRRMPFRDEILRGLLGADVIGFQHPDSAGNFLRVARHLLGLPTRGNTVLTTDPGHRTVTAAPIPTSIDTADIHRRAADPAVIARARQLRAELGDPRLLLLSIDRLEPTSGIEQRLTAIEELITEGLLRPNGVVVVQIALPSHRRGLAQDGLRHRVERQVARINGDHGRVGRPTVHYLHRSLPPDDRVALYLAADVLLATPLRDGMNLIAKDYLAARLDDTGALILSEFSGAAAELRAAHLVNPYDIEAVKSTILRAPAEPRHRARRRIRALRTHLHANDVHAWARRLLDTVERRVAPAPADAYAG